MSRPLPEEFSDRHPSVREKLRWLILNPALPEGAPAAVSAQLGAAGFELARRVKDGPQLTIALQHLIDAKDAAVRQAIADSTE